MKLSAQLALSRFRRIHDFLSLTQPPVALTDIRAHIHALGAVADRLAACAVEQDTRTRQGRAGTTTLRRACRSLRLEYMRPLHRASRALFRDDATVLAALTYPSRLRKPEALVATAHGMTNAAQPHSSRFIAEGFRPDFIDRVRTAATLVHDTLDQRATDIARRGACRSAVAAEIERGQALLSLLDAMISPRLEESAEFTAEWRSLMRQGRRGKVKAMPEEGATEPVLVQAPVISELHVGPDLDSEGAS